MKKQNSFAKDFIVDANKRGHVKEMAEVVGMPDDQDEKFLRELIARYERKNRFYYEINGRVYSKGILEHTVSQARREFEAGRKGSHRNVHAVVNTGSHMTYEFELPASFIGLIETYFPTIFRSRKHFRWFKRKLPGLMVRPK